jgi:hypothetical protein
VKRLFLDANVLFTAAHNPKGKAALLFQLGQLELVQLLSSAYAIEEARRNLARKFPACLDRFEALVGKLGLVAERPPDAGLDLPCPAGLPEKDGPIYRAAHACRADGLITGDLRDFGPLMNAPERCGGLLIQTVADWLQGLG